MKNNLILLSILNLFVLVAIIFIPMDLLIRGIMLGGMFSLLIFQYMILKIKRK